MHLWRNNFPVDGKLVVVAGGSKGLGRALALELAGKGANLLILAREELALNRTRTDLQAACVSSKQIVDAISVDLTQPNDIDRVLAHYHPPDVLICTAGGIPDEPGFLANLSPAAITSCLEQNYYTAIFPVQACLQRWLATRTPHTTRHIVLTSTATALASLPGYAAYTPVKAAIRALADTLRQELLLYGRDTFRVHCAFPANFLGESFLRAHPTKPRLTKLLEGTDVPPQRLSDNVPASREVARAIVRALEAGKTYITVDRRTELMLNHMRGPSPRFWTLYDLLMGWLAIGMCWVWRVRADRQTVKYGRENGMER
ncbi:NAD(P)-binding protein [Aspergillus campestris IBT 28561]|uniref:NAD(P)-binding protein n=1 Tax=Aspergillus campestris (strain IBT 28561) TaxID=1392248 RepID=A0A2I1DCP6_ASPC2|nr:NAD(P)-binding protein [Aspergillus campestris IBT 28561]PKY07644.1 NAD(P)-binding protein [Aspergillus campestris IBT 28561]